jgi:hypothetical protein
MRDEFDRLLPEYGLTKLYYWSFLRVHGYRSKVSAVDIVFRGSGESEIPSPRPQMDAKSSNSDLVASNQYGKQSLCREVLSLPRAKTRALGKEFFAESWAFGK